MPSATRPLPYLVDADLLVHVRFTEHAVERFSVRARLATASRRIVEPIMRDLLLREGRVVERRPHWARSRNTADLYLQLGEWMLFVGRRQRPQSTDFVIVTVINGPEGNTWRRALRRGYIFTPPPLLITDRPPRPSILISMLGTVGDRRSRVQGESLGRGIQRRHRERTRRAEEEYARAIEGGLRDIDARRQRAYRRARQRHLARYGLAE